MYEQANGCPTKQVSSCSAPEEVHSQHLQEPLLHVQQRRTRPDSLHMNGHHWDGRWVTTQHPVSRSSCARAGDALRRTRVPEASTARAAPVAVRSSSRRLYGRYRDIIEASRPCSRPQAEHEGPVRTIWARTGS